MTILDIKVLENLSPPILPVLHDILYILYIHTYISLSTMKIKAKNFDGFNIQEIKNL